VSAEAQTGSGKTAAFALPLLQRLAASPADGLNAHVRGLVLVPTRELALQVAGAFADLARFAPTPVRVLAVIGGASIQDQVADLYMGVAVVVATPGRLIDLLSTGDADLRGVEVLVLDEADKLLDAGFSEELGQLLQEVPQDRQTLLYSATLSPKVVALAKQVQRDPITVRIDAVPTPVEGIAQRVLLVDRHRRRMLLQHLIVAEQWGQTLVFVATQRATENLAAKLRASGLTATSLHGGLDQPERVRVLERFKRGRSAVLVATDLAARGIDFPELAAVVNFDLPRSTRDHVHRIGRTGRAGASGLAVSFIDHESEAHFKLIEKRTGIRLPREQVPGFECTGEAQKRAKGGPPVKGKRKSKKDKLREQAARGSTE
jgi:superfamily II DNA/RNA helicase